MRAALILPGITTAPAIVDFLLDTGASTTSLDPRDALTIVQIDPVILADPQYWQSLTVHTGIGGGGITYFTHEAHYGFLRDDGQVQEIRGQISIAQLRPDNRTIPSLLGWDILQHFHVSLDWSKRQIHLI